MTNPPGLIALADQVQQLVTQAGQGVCIVVLCDADGHAEARYAVTGEQFADALRQVADNTVS